MKCFVCLAEVGSNGLEVPGGFACNGCLHPEEPFAEAPCPTCDLMVPVDGREGDLLVGACGHSFRVE